MSFSMESNLYTIKLWILKNQTFSKLKKKVNCVKIGNLIVNYSCKVTFCQRISKACYPLNIKCLYYLIEL